MNKPYQRLQRGFTLLELLVVITLIATLATAGLVAYEGIGENAQDASAANNVVVAETAIRNYRAVENTYPNQWDNLANLDGTAPAATGVRPLLADQTESFIAQWTFAADSASTTAAFEVMQALASLGMDEFQTLDEITTFDNTAIPNLSFNESGPGVTAGQASELEIGFGAGVLDMEWDETSQGSNNVALSVFVSADDTTGDCTVDGGADISAAIDGTTVVGDNSALNLINDALSDDQCSLVLALGFGKDVPGTTIDSRVAIGQAPTASTENINPANDYARYIALFQVAVDEDADGDIVAGEVFARPRLIGIVDPEGRTLDEVIAGANADA